MYRRSLITFGVVCALAAPLVHAQVAPDPTPIPIGGKYDYWITPRSTSFSHVDIPAGFFGRGSDAWSGDIALVSDPFGPDAGAYKPADADTTMRRNRDPLIRNVGATDTVALRIYALSLRSDGPIVVSYADGSTELWDVHVGLSDLVAQPGGTLTATKTHANGGTFDSAFSVYPKFTFTPAGGGASASLDTGDPSWGTGASALQQGGGSWVDGLTGVPGGGFHPGYSDAGCGTPACINPAVLWYLLWMLNNCAQHNVGPCTTCPPGGGGGGGPIILPWEGHEGVPIGDEGVIIALPNEGDSDGTSSTTPSTRPTAPTGARPGGRVGP